jgi:long-chain-fatty-acid--CoA ligase ACSBG
MPWGYGCSSSILAKVTEALGLDQCKGSFTAAAPIAPETLFYFASINIPIFEVFGQSECTGPHTVSWKGEWKIGTCGRPMPGTESMIVPSTGELSYRGRHIFMGYMYDEAKTAETIDSEGYLHSGDVAEFDSNNKPGVTGPAGFMRITGRIKELIITAGGENIPPVLIENEMKSAMLAIANVVVIGDKRKYLSMVVSLKSEVDLETMTPTDKLAADSLFVASQIGSSATTVTEAAKVVSVHLAESESIFPLGWVVAPAKPIVVTPIARAEPWWHGPVSCVTIAVKRAICLPLDAP